MEFAVMFGLAWVTVFLFYSMDKSLSIPENAFIYLTILTIGIHISWIITEEFKLVELTKEGLLYTGYILYRSIFIPMIYVIMFNLIYKADSTILAIVVIGMAFGSILTFNELLRFYGVFNYKQWNIFYDALQIIVVQATGFALLGLYRKVIHREVNLP